MRQNKSKVNIINPSKSVNQNNTDYGTTKKTSQKYKATFITKFGIFSFLLM